MMSNPPWVLPVHSTSGTKGAASIVIGEVGGVSGTSTRGGSGVLSMTVSGDILNGDGRSQYTGVNVFPGDSGGVGGGVANWPSQPWSCRTHGVQRRHGELIIINILLMGHIFYIIITFLGHIFQCRLRGI
jgi:hypothetical protein